MRLIGPFRGGRVTSVDGVPGQPNVHYFGTPGGGIWKTTSDIRPSDTLREGIDLKLKALAQRLAEWKQLQ